MEYHEFIDSKRHSIAGNGIKASFYSESSFEFQNHIIEKCCYYGRYAGFIDTGLGKTLIELSVAQNFVKHTNKSVLILVPLAVAFQFSLESEKFNIGECFYTKDGKFSVSPKIILCNYERLHYLNPDDFDCVILDESSILKNFNGKMKNNLTMFLKKIKYRFLFSATPSPNDYHELGTSSEALGYMGYTDMLTKFFSNNENTIKSIDNIGNKFYLKPHAKNAFFNWVSQWSIAVRKPSDIGFSNDGYDLPKLLENNHVVKNGNDLIGKNGQVELFSLESSRLPDIRKDAKSTITERCEKAFELTKGHDFSVYWCNLNDESAKLSDIDKYAVELRGGMTIDQKEDILINFQKGKIKRLITKPKITCFGLNWQHCNHTVDFPTFSYEQKYQKIRRFWRFGQKRTVYVDNVYPFGHEKVERSLKEKETKSSELFDNLVKQTTRINKKQETKTTKIILPEFIK